MPEIAEQPLPLAPHAPQGDAEHVVIVRVAEDLAEEFKAGAGDGEAHLCASGESADRALRARLAVLAVLALDGPPGFRPLHAASAVSRA